MDGKMLGLVIMIIAGAVTCVVLGYGVLALGVCIAIIAVTWYLGLIGETSMVISLFVGSLIPILCLVIANQKYSKHES